jgi:hypothetical protein
VGQSMNSVSIRNFFRTMSITAKTPGVSDR